MQRQIEIALIALVVAGCPGHPLERPIPETVQQTVKRFPLSVERDLDILFVVDNSDSMGEEQVLLADQFVKLMLALGSLEGGFPNAHIGVVSTDLGAGPFSFVSCVTPGGDGACLQNTPHVPSCDGPTPERYIDIVNEDGKLDGNIPDVATPLRDVQDLDGDEDVEEIIGCDTSTSDNGLDACDVSEAFACIAQLGRNGCGFEQHLEASLRALSPANQAEGACGGGFLRETALLAVVVLADEDDCSAQNGSLYDPSSMDSQDPLGALQSFRCFEFGIECDTEITRTPGQTYTGCRPREEADCPWEGGCYLHPVSGYVDFFRTLKPRGRLLFAAIAGPWEPTDAIFIEPDEQGGPAVASSCGGDLFAAPGIRLRAVADALGNDGIYASDVNAAVCSMDYSPALDELNERIRSRLMPGCLPSPLTNATGDLISSPNEAQCTIEDVQNLGSMDEVSDLLPECVFKNDQGDFLCPAEGESPGTVEESPCWQLCDSTGLAKGLVCNTIEGTTADRWQLRICRDDSCDPATPAPDNSTALVACTTCNPALPGCLCGDGECQNDVEDEDNCSDDCG